MLFIALSCCYLSLSPGSIAGQGYAGEEIDSGLRLLEVVTAWLKGHAVPPMVWSRHGLVPVLFDLPFLKLGKLLVSPDFVLSFSPALFTAGLLTILFLWLRKVCTPGMSLFLTLTAAWGTMLWPYAYIGLETKQSFFVLLAGYLALAGGKIRRWPSLLLFAATCGIALSIKSTGITLWPVIAYLMYVQFWENSKARQAQILAAIGIIGVIWLFGHWGTNAFWTPRGGGGNNLKPWLIETPLQFFTNLVGVFGSPTKGLIVYAPVIIVSLYAVPQVFRTNREIAIYTLLVTTCAVGLLSLLKYPGDETWGCRYMHAAIAPLVLCIGAAWPKFRWRREGAALLPLAACGLVVSFLGAFYYYGTLNLAMKSAGQNTMEWINGDNDWNHILFNARIFGVWISNGTAAPVPWTPTHIWVWTAPPDALPWKSINLRDYCQPQSFMLRFWHVPKQGVVFRLFATYVFSLVIGVSLLLWVVVRTAKDQRSESTGELRLVVSEASAG
jgi:hypothetical protein